MLKELDKRLEKERNPGKAEILQGFFKTGKGDYGEGDIFLGIQVPVQREIAREFSGLKMEEIQKLLDSEIHEKRMIALLVLMRQFRKASDDEKKEMYDFYLENAARNRINNWDLVDLSCRDIVGEYLLDKKRDILYKLAAGNLWERRIAIVSTWSFIRKKDFSDTIRISEMLMKDKHDLIHKAVGWMLREMGKRDEKVLISFLDKNYKVMPRTMLRYSIEKLDEKTRKKYLNGEF